MFLRVSAWLIDNLSMAFIGFWSIAIIVAVSNIATMPILKAGAPRKGKKLSIMVPARNEERNIERCVRSLLDQDYEDYELIVLDDNSTDATGDILDRISKENPRLKVIKGTPLPEGWLGMNWACLQLARASTGEILMFVDSDTWHERSSASATVSVFENSKAGLVSGVTRQRYGGFLEMMPVMIMPWGMISLMPLYFMYHLKTSLLAIAAGQYMCFKRDDYFRIGGHEAVKAKADLDKELAKIAKRKGVRIMMVDATNTVSCRMYHNLKESFLGFSKNVFSAFDFKLVQSAATWIGITICILSPIAYVVTGGFNIEDPLTVLSLAQIAMALFLWGLILLKAKLPLYWALLYPIIMLTWVGVGFNSMYQAIFGNSSWKGRNMPKPRVRLI